MPDVAVISETDGKISVEWNVTSYFPFKVGSFSSPQFEFLNAKWCLFIINIEGTGSYIALQTFSEDEHHVSLSLALKTNGVVINSFEFEYTFGKTKKTHTSHPIIENNRSHKFTKLTVFCEICVIGGICKKLLPSVKTLSAIESSPSSLGVENLSKNFENILLSGLFHDVLIKVGDQQFKAHKIVLAAQSDVFSAMLHHEMSETSSGIIEIDDCEPQIFKDFLLALYSGKFSHVTCQNALSLYKVADKYNFKDLKKECSRRLTHELSVDMICDVIQLATLHNESEMLENATKLFITNSDEIVGTEKWKSFMFEHPSLASELIVKIIKTLK